MENRMTKGQGDVQAWNARKYRKGTVTLRLLAGVAVWCAAGCALGAPQCASYEDEEGESTITLVSPARLEVRPRGQSPRFYQYRQNGDRLDAINLSDLYDQETLILLANGKRLTGLYGDKSRPFLRVKSFACQTDAAPSADPEVRACQENLKDCRSALHRKTDAQMEALCAARLPFGCLELLKRVQESSETSDELEEKELPPVCREGEVTFDMAACKQAFEQALTKALAKVFQSLYTDVDILPTALLERLPALCRDNVSAQICAKAAEHLWDAGRFFSAREAFSHACQMPIGDPEACQHAAALEVLTDANAAAPVALEALPCGHYVMSEDGLMSEFDFGDRGITHMGEYFSSRARLENGLVRIRHDKGGDFVLRALANGMLVGQDQWNRYAIYQRENCPTQCAAPVLYHETELKMDCRAGEDMESCCARGGIQGCNGMGNMAALQDDWQKALSFYANVCQTGVRSGCENMRTVFMEGIDEAKETLETICAKDDLHVACDILETTNWKSFAAIRELKALEKALKEAAEEEGEDAETDDEED
jgi:hypothetical protein